jgi:hypothetical protein
MALLRREMTRMALSGHTKTICYLSAFGAERTCREGRSVSI